MTSFKSIVEDIKSLKIQGAQNIAKASIKAVSIISEACKSHPPGAFVNNIIRSKNILFKTRPTEPALRNALNYATFKLSSERNPYTALKNRLKFAIEHFDNSEKEIAKIGIKKLSNNYIVYTHCHSSTVTNILKNAKQNGIRLSVHNTETRPRFQGRLTATELSKAGIPVTHYIDSAARQALKKADIMLIGADAITSEGKVINKIGSEMFAEIAQTYGVPVYVCTDSWKFDPQSIFGYEEEIEIRSEKEVWQNAPRGVKINNIAFEKITPDLITGIISEIGVFRPEIFVSEVRRTYPWMF